jgi:hypothetical protein
MKVMPRHIIAITMHQKSKAFKIRIILKDGIVIISGINENYMENLKNEIDNILIDNGYEKATCENSYTIMRTFVQSKKYL